MNTNDLKRMYGSTPQSFQNRVQSTVSRCQIQQQPARAGRRGLRVALVTALLLALGAAVAAAAFSTQVAEWFGRFYGGATRDELLAGNTAQSGQSVQLGDVLYTLDEVTYIEFGLYGVGRITPANDGVVLMAEDLQVTDPAGYDMNDLQTAPPDAKSYAQLAREQGARILMPTLYPEAVGISGSDPVGVGSYGYMYVPQQDGSIRFLFELPTSLAVAEGDLYDLQFWAACWEVSPEGEHLRDGPSDTYHGQEWLVTVEPKPPLAN